jgi:lipopolysaccharide/colanic/teichoic acid biosynthesis glycosyltransferase
MVNNPFQNNNHLAVTQEDKITCIGRILRKTKIDELPQLINVLKGEMSIVGPRPEVGRYVEMFRQDYEEILKVRPGITDLASLKYHDEVEILRQVDNFEDEYVRLVLSEKINLAKDYIKRSSFFFDLSLILKTLLKLLL